MQKYYLLEWPESKKYLHNKECIRAFGKGMACFVPCDVYDNSKS